MTTKKATPPAAAAASTERETATATIGNKTITFVELSFQESRAVDKYVDTDEDTGLPKLISVAKIYALGAIRSINGVAVNACTGELGFKHVESKFTAMEGIALAGAYGRAFGSPESGEELKNESSDPA